MSGPRLVSNTEVQELIRGRSALHRSFKSDERDKKVEAFLGTMEVNLAQHKGMGVDVTAAVTPDGPSFEKCKMFLEEVKLLESASQARGFGLGFQLMPSEKLQLLNLRPDSSALIRVIVPDRDMIITEEDYIALGELVQKYLLQPEVEN
mmetsp:Transcript_10564/g.19488  ORF Transcript_10564/g.19488 Transcript_10564/m.19488 type:complete len:149 (-) Transcript_10564:144-590(-)|eukprot:CAMPEP_0184514692 /NCGR_PEP_ID=MMETSP0198_2-20121128/4100_1 /TAXON_ID=1112570 /ORGANISM="Thraustochytrium sp., Strain LLF1b" /LENGTH=148 /DNA_ID=CAMNT_0026904901 /DNA_START=374 /DNA_END=820 /DNA_ORIENTATION=-